LDVDVVKLGLSLPETFKIRSGTGKIILRDVLRKYIPKDLIKKPKMGFGVPLSDWLRNDLRDWCEDLLDKKKLDEEGLFNSNYIHKKWKSHLNKKEDLPHELWNILIFQSWLYSNKN